MVSSKPKVEFVIFSDVHAHAFRYGARKVECDYADGLYNSRLVDTLDALHEMKAYVEKHLIQDVLFAGDMYHVRSNVLTVAGNLVYEFLGELAETATVTMIPGNHDYADREGLQHALTPLATSASATETIQVLEGVSEVVCGSYKAGLYVYTVPYVDNPLLAQGMLKEAAQLAKKRHPDIPAVLLGHLGFQGAKVGSDYVLVRDNDNTVDDVDGSAFNACFFGHYHEHQKLFPNGWYVGALTQHDWGCRGGKRGFLHVTIENGKTTVKRIETKAPKFVLLDESDEDSLEQKVRPCDFVQYLTKSLDLSATKEQVEKLYGSHNVEVIHVPEEVGDVTLSLEANKLQPDNLVSAWCAAHEVDDYTRQLGLEIMAEAAEQNL